MTNYEEIKKMLKTTRTILEGKKGIQESREIKYKHGLINEQPMEKNSIDTPDNIFDRDNPMKSIQKNIDYETADSEQEGMPENKQKADKKKGYRISGGILFIYGTDSKDLQLTTEDKTAFQESMDEFVSEVAEIVDFNKLNLYPNNVEWSGKITEYDVEFFFSIGENNGVYINGTMMQIDDDFLELIEKLKSYYEKFKSKWSKVIAVRKKTQE
jgi:hypothetical protein